MSIITKLGEEFVETVTTQTSKLENAWSSLGPQIDADTILPKLSGKKQVPKLEIKQSGIDNAIQTHRKPNGLVDRDAVLADLRRDRRDYYTEQVVEGPQILPIRLTRQQDTEVINSYHQLVKDYSPEEFKEKMWELDSDNLKMLIEDYKKRDTARFSVSRDQEVKREFAALKRYMQPQGEIKETEPAFKQLMSDLEGYAPDELGPRFTNHDQQGLAELDTYIELNFSEGDIDIAHDLVDDFRMDTGKIEIGELRNFPPGAYADITLPDTNAASYEVTLFHNPATDRKGHESDAHWSEIHEFHARTDNVMPWAQRIQEVQSDLQISMTKRKNREVELWQLEAKDLGVPMSFITDKITKPYHVEKVPEIVRQTVTQIRKDTGIQWMKDTSLSTGLEFTNIRNMNRMGLPAARAETGLAIVRKFVDGATTDGIRGTPLNDWLNDLMSGANPGPMGPDVKRQLLNNTNLDPVQITTIDDVVDSMKDDFEHIAQPMVDAHMVEVQKEILARRTATQRTSAALAMHKKAKATHAESAEAKVQLAEAYEDVLATEGLVVNSAPEGKEMIGVSTVQAKLDKGIETIIDEIEEFYSHGRKMPQPPDSNGQVASVMFGNPDESVITASGVKILDEVYGAGTGEAVNDISAKVLKLASKKTDTALNKINKLKPFPRASEFELDVPWRKQAIQSRVVKSLQAGQTEVWLTINPPGTKAVPGSGLHGLMRGPGPQEEYETDGRINKAFRDVAKKIKASLVEEDGYLKMILPRASAAVIALASFNTYADTNRVDYVNEAVAMGATPEEATTRWYEQAGASENEYQAKVEEALAMGATQEEIDGHQDALFQQKTFAKPEHLLETTDEEGNVTSGLMQPDTVVKIGEQIGADPWTPNGIRHIYQYAQDLQDPEKAEERLRDQEAKDQLYLAQLEKVYMWDNSYQQLLGMFGNEEASAAEHAKAKDASIKIIEAGKSRGLDLSWDEEYGTWMITHPNGDVVNATPGLLAMMSYEAASIGFSQTAAAAGLAQWSPVTGALARAPGWHGKLFSGLVRATVAVTYGWAGSMIGAEVDYMAALINSDEEWQWDMAYQKLQGTAIDEGVGLFINILMAGGGGGSRMATRMYRMIKNGNRQGAIEMAQIFVGATKQATEEAIRAYEIVNGALKVEGPTDLDKFQQKALTILPITRAGGENIIAAVAERNPRASGVIANDVAQRAREIREHLELGSTGIEFAETIVEAYNDYLVLARFHGQVIRDQGVEFAPVGYQYNSDKMVSRVLNRDLMHRMSSGDSVRGLRNEMSEIKDRTEGHRGFSNLLELRETIENLKIKAVQPTSEDLQIFDDILERIDKEVETVVLNSGKEGALQWFADWTTSKSAKGDMIRIQRRKLGQMLEHAADQNRIGEEVDYADISREILKSGRSVNGILPDLLNKLPIPVQQAIERDMISQVAARHTAGDKGAGQAMQFPMMADELAEYNFQFPESRAFVKMINQFAETYQIDVGLAYASGKVFSIQFQSYLTANPLVRAKFQIASATFNKANELMGGPLGDSAAMVNHVTELLKDPLNPKTVSAALEAVKGEVALEIAIKTVSKEEAAAKHAGREQTVRIKTFIDSNGMRWAKSAPGRTEADPVPRHVLITEADVLEKFDLKSLDHLDAFAKAKLLKEGFRGVGRENGSLLELADNLL